MHWRISLFGGLQVEGNKRTITRFQTRQTGLLLAYLAYHLEKTHRRESLIEMLWPECDPAAGRARLSTALSSLRRQLEPPGLPAGPVILADRSHVRLHPDSFTTDVAEFESTLRDAARARNRAERTHKLADAVDRYQHSLLSGYHEQWVLEEREALAERYFRALTQLLAQLEQGNELARAIDYGRRGVTLDPLREEVHFELIRLLAAAGQPAAALRQFGALTEILRRELATAPTPPTRALARQIQDQLSAAPSSLPTLLDPPPGRRVVPATGDLPADIMTLLLVEIDTVQFEAETEQSQATERKDQWSRLRRRVRRHSGCLLEGGGHPFCAGFSRASKAMACAAEIYHECPLARVAIHTGEVRQEEPPYAELLHLATRVLVAAHPGQILLTEATAALLRHDQEAALRLTDLGAYQLRDPATPDRLYQANALAGESQAFPLPKAPRALAGRIPAPLDRFVGREEEIAEIQGLLREFRLVTLTGVAGVGKTRLAVETCHRLTDAYPGAAWFVPLAGLSDPQLIADRILQVLRLPDSPHSTPLDQLIVFLSRQPTLLALDNFEHLLDTGVPLVEALLHLVPSLTCLVTSRQRLDLPGERELSVRPLPVPSEPQISRDDPDSRLPDSLSALLHCASVRLFLDRAQEARPDFQVTAANAEAISALCTELEGLPLALELAAARIWASTPSQMLARLSRRFELLTSHRRSVEPRHRSLRAALDWSYQLLSPELQRFFVRLSVFRGGWTLDAAAAVCEEPQALDHLEELLACSLIEREETVTSRSRNGTVESQPDDPRPGAALRPDLPRFRMLEALREFAALQLAPEETAELRQRYETFYMVLVRRAEPELYGPAPMAWLERLEQETDNLRAVLDGSTQSADPARSLELAAALGRFWYVRGNATEGRARLAHLLSRQVGTGRTAARAGALHAAARLAVGQSDYEAARSLYQEELAIRRELRDRGGEAGALAGLGNIARAQGSYHTAQTLLDASLTLAVEDGDLRIIAPTHLYLGILTQGLLDYATARSHYQKGLELYRQQGDVYGIGSAIHQLGFIALTQCDYDDARAYLEEGLRIARELGDQDGIGASFYQLGHVALQQADPNTARGLFESSLEIHRERGDRFAVACDLHSLGELAQQENDFEAARRFYDQALEMRRAMDCRQSIAWTLRALGSLARCEGDDRNARALFEESRALLREVGDRPGVAAAIYELGYLALGQGEFETAHRFFQESLPLQRELGAKLGIGASVHGIGEVARHRGDLPAAERCYREALAVWRGTGFNRGIAGCLDGLARLAFIERHWDCAIRWFAAAEALRCSACAPRSPQQQQEYIDHLTALRSEVGEPAFAATWEASQVMSWEEAAAGALAPLSGL